MICVIITLHVKKISKLGCPRLSHFVDVTQLVPGRNVAIRSPGRCTNKEMTRLDEAQRSYMREKMAPAALSPMSKKGDPGKERSISLCNIQTGSRH